MSRGYSVTGGEWKACTHFAWRWRERRRSGGRVLTLGVLEQTLNEQRVLGEALHGGRKEVLELQTSTQRIVGHILQHQKELPTHITR